MRVPSLVEVACATVARHGHFLKAARQAIGNTAVLKSAVGQDFILRPIFNRPSRRRFTQRFVVPETVASSIVLRSRLHSTFSRSRGVGTSERRSLRKRLWNHRRLVVRAMMAGNVGGARTLENTPRGRRRGLGQCGFHCYPYPAGRGPNTHACRVATLHKPRRKPLKALGSRRRLWGRISSCGRFSIGPPTDACHKGFWRQRRSRRGSTPARAGTQPSGSPEASARVPAQHARVRAPRHAPLYLQRHAGRFVESVAAAHTGVWATTTHDNTCPQSRRFVAPGATPQGIIVSLLIPAQRAATVTLRRHLRTCDAA